MSHLRVLICRVEDETEQMTELASVDLPPVLGQWASVCWGGCVLGEGTGLVEAGARAEEGAQFIVCRTEAGSGAWRSRARAWGRSVA